MFNFCKFIGIRVRKQDQMNMEKDKIVFKGSHPDSLYRVVSDHNAGVGKISRLFRVLRWPIALLTVCIALAFFVYFLMPDNLESDFNTTNSTYWEPSIAGAHLQKTTERIPDQTTEQHKTSEKSYTHGPKTPEIDFYDAENTKQADLTTFVDSITEAIPARKLPIEPVFPARIIPEVQYGNEKADAKTLRSPKLLGETNDLLDESTLKPHITQKPEKPLAIYFKDGDITTTTETINRAESMNDLTSYNEKQKKNSAGPAKSYSPIYRPVYLPNSKFIPITRNQDSENQPQLPPEIQDFLTRGSVNADIKFTSGHSKIFGVSVEDIDKMKSTTQSSLYNTRVSPTLPTWRDDNDSTTKKYPSNYYTDVPQCRSTRLALCRDVLPYDLAGTPASVRGVEVTSLLPQIEYLVASNCSDRVRHFTCALLEPECNPPPYPMKMPCQGLCKAIVDNCEGMIPRELAPLFNCNQYSKTNCLTAKTPCFPREMTCGDGSCVPRDWMCDGTTDCPNGEDETNCTSCDKNEFRCESGNCISSRWVCDGYADCANGEDELDTQCGAALASAPAPALSAPPHATGLLPTGDGDSSKELLITSDSTNALKRNFTRRPSPSRLTPYSRPIMSRTYISKNNKPGATAAGAATETRKSTDMQKLSDEIKSMTENPKTVHQHESIEDVNIGDLAFFDDIEKDNTENKQQPSKQKVSPERAPLPEDTPTATVKFDKSVNKFERVIDGASLLRKAEAAAVRDEDYSPENTNHTKTDVNDDFAQEGGALISHSSHASPCPSGELRCVDGRCITLAQLCDGTIDCSDHADEDNCYT